MPESGKTKWHWALLPAGSRTPDVVGFDLNYGTACSRARLGKTQVCRYRAAAVRERSADSRQIPRHREFGVLALQTKSVRAISAQLHPLQRTRSMGMASGGSFW